MSERDRRVFLIKLDAVRDADVIGRIEVQPSFVGYVRELVRRDMHDERLDYAALKASELLAENAKLRNDLEDANNQAEEVCIENTKLRELVRDMNKWLWNGADCTECPFIAECNLNVAFESDRHANICIGWREIHNRMRELGVDA